MTITEQSTRNKRPDFKHHPDFTAEDVARASNLARLTQGRSNPSTQPTMSDIDAVMTIECPDESTTRDDVIAAFQALINSGTVWSLQGSYGRAAAQLIEAGECSPA